MNKKQFKIYTASFIIIFVVVVSIIIFSLMNNFDFLLMMRSGLDKPSKMYTKVTKQIFKQFNTENTSQKIIKIIEENKSAFSNSSLFYFLGIIGDKSSTQFLIDSCKEYENKPQYYSIMHNIICAMGFIGDEKFVPILKDYLDNHEKYNSLPTKGTVAQAIYLITGERYYYINRWGEKSALIITDELMAARDVVLHSTPSERTIDEMICLDNLDNPPAGLRINGKIRDGVDY